MISVNNSVEQDVSVSITENIQKITIENSPNQYIDICESKNTQDINIEQELPQHIDISLPGHCDTGMLILIDSKVPKSLSILPQVSDEAFETMEAREAIRLYVDVDGTPSFANAEQIKKMSTKIIMADDLTDQEIDKLSNGDFVLLQERR